MSGLYMIASILVGQYFRGEQLTSAITTMGHDLHDRQPCSAPCWEAMLAAFPPHGMMIGLGFALVAFTGLAILQRDHQMPPG